MMESAGMQPLWEPVIDVQNMGQEVGKLPDVYRVICWECPCETEKSRWEGGKGNVGDLHENIDMTVLPK